ncbi:PepSY domain-containing protein [Vogesella indigofera]|uniref:PepSY domain-containing protein n=1 Tax=Vogesella indigofera TaxID=45465 RepID=UPI003F43DE95
MKKLIAVALMAAFASSAAFAGAECAAQPKDKWQKEADFQKQLTTQGYQIKKFKVSGNCYEIYGKNKQGQKVEIYFDPVSGKAVKSEIDD